MKYISNDVGGKRGVDVGSGGRITITQFASVELDYRGGGTCNCSRQIEQALETGKLPLITSQSMDTMC